ncbi:MAG TPA: choice-of-anchor tandem repeat GloVer-containing protein [Bryobacteraceae bacterium]|nr:choice-of-anchor tandem repeat GloVer-containing protein [Bryobacteraceae bacterium]
MLLLKISSALLLGLLLRSIAFGDTAKPVVNQIFTFQLAPDSTFPDGTGPGPIIQASDGNFYGTTELGGDDGNHCQQPQACGGTIFKLTPAGQITILYTFAYGSATAPYANGVNTLPKRLVEGPDGYLYGTTYAGGNGSRITVSSGGGGTVFKISKTGDFHTLHQFCAGAGCDEGSGPSALVLGPDGKFYGTTLVSGSNHAASKGTIFRISAAGVVETLHNFDGFADGGAPLAGLVQASDGNLYGTTSGGGNSQYAVGTVFRITPAGVFSVLYTFQLQKPNPIKDGQDPEQPLIQACHGKLYGVTKRGGLNQYGTVFQIGLDGQGYKTLFDLTKSQFGYPSGLLLATDDNLWGGTSLANVIYTVSTAGVLLQTSAPICAGVGINGPLIQGMDGKLYGSAQQCAFPSGGSGTIFSVDAGLPKPPVPIVDAATNGASFVAGSIVPGEIATVFGTEITSSTGINLASTLPLPTDFQNVSVLVNGIAAPIFAVDNVNGQQQINFQVPWEVAGQSTATIEVEFNCHTSAPLTVAVLPAQPGIINYSAGGASYGVILHADYQLADAGHPVKAGETVLIYGTGSGTVISPPADGAAASGQITTAPAVVTIGGVTAASVPFSGLAPGFVGLNQINVVVPAGLTPGNQPVVVTIDGVASNAVQLPVH